MVRMLSQKEKLLSRVVDLERDGVVLVRGRSGVRIRRRKGLRKRLYGGNDEE